jgi:hypothetical protein
MLINLTNLCYAQRAELIHSYVALSAAASEGAIGEDRGEGREEALTIQIDDAGWGSLVGPTFIGAYRPETGEFACGTVDLRFFRGQAYARKAYLQETTRVIQDLLEQLGADGDEPVQICTGYVFDHARRNLRRKVRQAKITGRLQDLIEGVARDYLRDLGIPIDGVGPGSGHFMACFRWVAEDLEKRERFVKAGWKSWRTKWRQAARRRGAR